MTEAAAASAAAESAPAVIRWICDECHARGEFSASDALAASPDSLYAYDLFVTSEHVKSAPECFSRALRMILPVPDTDPQRLRSEDIRV